LATPGRLRSTRCLPTCRTDLAGDCDLIADGAKIA
jgi:hypothetical protein